MNNIIAAYAGTGKTYFASLYPQFVIDLVCMPYKYHLEKKPFYNESDKANIDNIPNEEWPLNYISEIKGNIKSNKIILIPTDYFVLGLLKYEKINYTLCYPHRSAKDAFLNRYINRGNNEEFLKVFIGKWDKFIDNFENDTFAKHIVLQADDYLSDVVDVSLFNSY